MERPQLNIGTPEAERSPETWRQLEREASTDASVLLKERNLLVKIETLNQEDLKKLFLDVSALIDEFSFDGHKKLKNENRYIVRELAVYLHKIQAQMTYDTVPTPAFMQQFN